jgi:hypothetical protein
LFKHFRQDRLGILGCQRRIGGDAVEKAKVSRPLDFIQVGRFQKDFYRYITEFARL